MYPENGPLNLMLPVGVSDGVVELRAGCGWTLKNFFRKSFLNFVFRKGSKRKRVLTSLAGFHVEVQEQVVQGHLFACRQGEVLGRVGR